MSLALYLIGAPRSGKTAVFDALTNTPEGPHFAVKDRHRYGTVKVPDARLETLRDMFKPKKFTPAEVTFVDVTPPGEEIQFADMTPLLGNADAFVVVVQAFGEYDGQGKPLNSATQFEDIVLEITVADHSRIDKRIERAIKDKSHGLKITDQEMHLLERCRDHLANDRALRTMQFTDDEEKLLRTYQFLSQKPIVAVANVGEDRIDGSGLEALEAATKARDMGLMRFCAPLEAEIAQLSPSDQAEFLKDYGLTEPARVRLLQTAYHSLHLISFFTVGEDEVRAWTIRKGTRAQTAAGKIHSDIERGFIRAETVGAADLIHAGNIHHCREHGTLRLEGKDYPVRDGDVINFRFNA